MDGWNGIIDGLPEMEGYVPSSMLRRSESEADGVEKNPTWPSEQLATPLLHPPGCGNGMAYSKICTWSKPSTPL